MTINLPLLAARNKIVRIEILGQKYYKMAVKSYGAACIDLYLLGLIGSEVKVFIDRTVVGKPILPTQRNRLLRRGPKNGTESRIRKICKRKGEKSLYQCIFYKASLSNQ